MAELLHNEYEKLVAYKNFFLEGNPPFFLRSRRQLSFEFSTVVSSSFDSSSIFLARYFSVGVLKERKKRFDIACISWPKLRRKFRRMSDEWWWVLKVSGNNTFGEGKGVSTELPYCTV